MGIHAFGIDDIPRIEDMVMIYLIALKDTVTGDRRTVEFEYAEERVDAEENDRLLVYLWTEGNYGCDCNRSLKLWELDLAEDDNGLECNRGDNRILLLSIHEKETGRAIGEDDWQVEGSNSKANSTGWWGAFSVLNEVGSRK